MGQVEVFIRERIHHIFRTCDRSAWHSSATSGARWITPYVMRWLYRRAVYSSFSTQRAYRTSARILSSLCIKQLKQSQSHIAGSRQSFSSFDAMTQPAYANANGVENDELRRRVCIFTFGLRPWTLQRRKGFVDNTRNFASRAFSDFCKIGCSIAALLYLHWSDARCILYRAPSIWGLLSAARMPQSLQPPIILILTLFHFLIANVIVFG